MKRLYVIGLATLSTFFALAQTSMHQAPCLTDKISHQLMDANPELYLLDEELEAFTKKFIEQEKAKRGSRSIDSTTVYTVPVVYHILHNGNNENLSDATILQDMTNLNEYWSRSNAELASAHPKFKDSLIADMNVEFVLAKKDPKGNCTNGIIRHYTQATHWGDNDTKLSPWPREKYLNIWVVRCLRGDCGPSGTLAYSQYPAAVANYVNNQIVDGVICKWGSVGLTSPSAGLKTTMAHEVGHWANLKHTWGDTNEPGAACGDDDVEDTPPTKGGFGCNKNRQECNPGVIESEENIMNYSSCAAYFTKGQRDRVRAALNSPIAGRSTLISPANLAATGVLPLNNCQPQPVADFTCNKRFVCAGVPVQFKQASYNATIDNVSWTFPADADKQTSTSNTETVTFTTPGWKEISLTANSAGGSNTKVKQMVYVSDPGNPVITPYLETFENQANVAQWAVLNYDNNQTFFSHYTRSGHSSQSSMQLNNYASRYRADMDELVSPPYDLTALDDANFRFSFRYSFATFNQFGISSPDDSMYVSISKDCGATWVPIYRNGGNQGRQLYNAGYVAEEFHPQPSNDNWRRISIDLKATLGANVYNQYKGSNIVFKFGVTSSYLGNNFYLDNINIGNANETVLGLNEAMVEVSGVSVFPNPANGQATVELTASTKHEASIKLIDLTGKEVLSIYNGLLDQGTQQFNFDTQALSSGLYQLVVQSGKSSSTTKFVKL